MVQPRRAAFWVFVVLLLFGGAAVLADEYHGFAVTATAHLALLPVWLAFIAATGYLILLFDPFRSMRRHWSILIAAAALGATCGQCGGDLRQRAGRPVVRPGAGIGSVRRSPMAGRVRRATGRGRRQGGDAWR